MYETILLIHIAVAVLTGVIFAASLWWGNPKSDHQSINQSFTGSFVVTIFSGLAVSILSGKSVLLLCEKFAVYATICTIMFAVMYVRGNDQGFGVTWVKSIAASAALLIGLVAFGF